MEARDIQMGTAGPSGFDPPVATVGGPGGSGTGLNTLDEPVLDTIKRDLNQIGEKLYYVMLPRARQDKGSGLKKWDLWGPLFLCLMLSTILASQSHGEQAGRAFALVFIIFWLGSGVVTLNSLLLKGKISFFQSVCVLGYCVFPLVISAFVCAFIKIRVIKIIVVILGFVWSTGASVGFMSDIVPEDRKALGVYPVWLFYVIFAWMILLT